MCFWRGWRWDWGVGRGGGGGTGEGALLPKKKKKALSSLFLLEKTKRGTESAKFVKEAEKVQKSSIKGPGNAP